MEKTVFELSPAVHEAFAVFRSDKSYLALPLLLEAEKLQPASGIRFKDTNVSFQNALNELDVVLNPRTPLYLILRRDNQLFAITYAPYLAKEKQRAFFLENRNELVRVLGQEQFSMALICKEIGEITDARSWDERMSCDDCGQCEKVEAEKNGVKDVGYKKNKCRLCDRRMKNKISPEALGALGTLGVAGATVQLSVDISSETLELNFSRADLSPDNVAATLPTNKPSFTFYRHPGTHLLYFIYHSPDSATVQERMKHTMAIPGLINVHAEDQDVHVDQKIEIHDPDDLVFEAKDERIGKFRSVYLRNKFEGTESTYKSLEADKKFYNDVK